MKSGGGFDGLTKEAGDAGEEAFFAFFKIGEISGSGGGGRRGGSGKGGGGGGSGFFQKVNGWGGRFLPVVKGGGVDRAEEGSNPLLEGALLEGKKGEGGACQGKEDNEGPLDKAGER